MQDWSLEEASPVALAGHRAALVDAVDALYAAFVKRPASAGGPDACTACCAAPQAMARIAAGPLQAISYDDLNDYLSAAKGPGAGQDLAHLLPRIMEVLAGGQEPVSTGLFAVYAHYFPSMWDELSVREQAAVTDYTVALIRWLMAIGPEQRCDYGIMDVIEMLASGGIDTVPMLAALAAPPDTRGAVRAVAELVLHGARLWQRGGRGFYQVAPEQAADIAAGLRAALRSSRVLALLETAALLDDDAEFAGQASLAHQIAETIPAD